MEVKVEVDPVFIPPPPDPIIAGGPPGGSAKLLLERANPFPFALKLEKMLENQYCSMNVAFFERRGQVIYSVKSKQF